MKLGSQDKPFITAELKNLHRRKGREYCKRGISEKYLELKKKFDTLYKREAQSYLNKTVSELRISNPGKMYSVLKWLGSKPGDLDQETSFTLPLHEQKGLTDQQSAELIAQHFAEISQEHLHISKLPIRVQDKLKSPGKPPTVTEFETFHQINA